MKTGIASDGMEPESKVAKRFGQAEYILVYDADSKNYRAIKNIKEHSHKNLDEIAGSGINNFIVGNIGPNSYYTLKSLDCKIFLARNKTAAEAVSLFLSGGLKELSEPTVKQSIGRSEEKRHSERHKAEGGCCHGKEH